MTKPDIKLWLDDHRGVYIPRDFAQCFIDRDKTVSGVKTEDWAILESGPDNESYWDAWTDVLDSAIVTETDGTRYRLHQDGALWLIPEGMEFDDQTETFVWPEPVSPALRNIRRDLESAAWLQYSPVPFAGAIHDFSRPMAERLKSREFTGPYYFSPAKPGTGRGFYQSSKGLSCDKAGSSFDLRLELANDHLGHSRLANINGYFCDSDGDGDTLEPIVARLPKGRGFLAGWTMGRGMCASLDATIYDDISDAAMAAHDMAESDAEKNRDADESDSNDSED